MELKKYRVHWWYDDGRWEITEEGTSFAEELMQGDPIVELDPELVRSYEEIQEQEMALVRKIRAEVDRQYKPKSRQ